MAGTAAAVVSRGAHPSGAADGVPLALVDLGREQDVQEAKVRGGLRVEKSFVVDCASMLIFVGGLPGTGKTSIARAFSQATSGGTRVASIFIGASDSRVRRDRRVP